MEFPNIMQLNEYKEKVNNFKNGELKRFLCDLFGFNYHIDNKALINFVKDKITS